MTTFTVLRGIPNDIAIVYVKLNEVKLHFEIFKNTNIMQKSYT